MIWYDIKKLETALVNGEVSDKEGYNYLLVSMILMTLASYSESGDLSNKWFLLIKIAMEIFFTVAMMQVSFDLNQKGDKKDYFKRFISISMVAGIRLIVLVLIVSVPVGVIMFFVNKSIGDDQSSSEILELIAIIIFFIAYYYMFTNSFKRVHPKIS